MRLATLFLLSTTFTLACSSRETAVGASGSVPTVNNPESRPGLTRRIWYAFAPDGKLKEQVRIPTSLKVMDVGEDFVLAIARDANDVEIVREYRLRRTSGMN